MDVLRPEHKRRKRSRQVAIGGGVALLLTAAAIGLARLEPAAPSVSRASVWIDTVHRGEMLRQVQGTGTLVPREIRWIAAQTDGRVERILVQPGTTVQADTLIVEMSNVELSRETEEARYALQAAQGEFAEEELKVHSQQLDQQAALAIARTEHESARLQADAEKPLAEQGVVPMIQYRRSQLLFEQQQVRMNIEQERLEQFSASMDVQIAARRAHLAQVRNTYELRVAQLESLRVHAGLAGVLQQVMVEMGQRVALGVNIARVARPDRLKAELHIPETQARDVQIGQLAHVDTRDGIVEGRVSRIDPAVQAGTVQVDVEFEGALPRGARPDLSIDGTIEIERLPHVVFTGRPAVSQPDSTVNLYKIVDAGHGAIRVPVQLGRASVNTIEILKGLVPGDEVILSDTSSWSQRDRIKLN